MSTLIATADGNLTGLTTFAVAEVGATSLNLTRFATTNFSNGANSSVSFTVTNGKIIDGAILWVKALQSSGTFKVDLQKGGVSQASVTVNNSDLPSTANAVPQPMFFKFTGTATGDGGSNWTLVITTGLVEVQYYYTTTGTTTSFTRALRTTTTAAPAATDDLYIVGELTGAGTHNSRVVTMDSTAATAYGNGSVNSTTVSGGLIAVSCYGTLSYGTTAATNYVLRVNGDLIVYQFGTLSIGTSGAEIPRDSTAVLEFQQVSADGDFGLRGLDNSVISAYGLSRTVGKNIVRAKLTADVTSGNLLNTSGNDQSGTTSAVGVDYAGTIGATVFTDTGSNAAHSVGFTSPNVVNPPSQGASVWLARGTGANNRYVRFTVGQSATYSGITNGFYADIDLQLGTIGTITAIGSATATSATITAVDGGYVCRIVGQLAAGNISSCVVISACSAPGTLTYAGGSTSCFMFKNLVLKNTSNPYADTTYSVDTDTGWLSGDAVCVAATSRTATECNDYLLNADAGASSFTSAIAPFNQLGTATHSGTSPTQAEVGLLTRNVKIRSTSSTLMAYVYCAALATVNFQWAEMYYFGTTSTANKRGLEIDGGATANAKSFTYCSIHDCDARGLYFNVNSQASINVTFSNNVMWNSLASEMFSILGPATLADWTMDSNIFIKGVTGTVFNDESGTFTNNYISSFTTGMSFTTGGTFGTWSGNEIHACTTGVSLGAVVLQGTFGSPKIWRNLTQGILNGGTLSSELFFSNITAFGNGININWFGGTHLNIIGTGSILSGDTTFASTTGVSLGSSSNCVFDLSNVDFSGSGTGLAVNTTNDILCGASSVVAGVLNNCKFGAATPIGGKATWYASSYLSMEKYGQTAGDHRTEMTYGTLKTDTSIFNGASPSMRMTPNNASSKLQSAPKSKNGIVAAVASGASISISASARKSVVGDGTAYNGNQPRLIQRANAALGQSADVVLATYSAAAGSWNTLSATSSIATDDGAFEFIVDCDGTTGWINVDDWNVA